MNLGANLLTTDTQITLSNSGVQQFASAQAFPVLVLLRRTSDGATEIIRMVTQVSASVANIIRGQLGSPVLAFTTADTATLMTAQVTNDVQRYIVGSPLLGTTNYVLAATALTGSPQTITVGITNPDVCRNATITGNTGGMAGNVIVHGTDFLGNSISESIALSGTSTVSGNLAFATVTEIDLPVQSSGGNTVKVGTGSKLGLDAVVTRDTILKAFLANVPETLGSWTVATGTGIANCTVTIASALNGTQVILDHYSS